jgi:murein DD-endopeptidase MepM/ murein hydrolase activator NlpD
MAQQAIRFANSYQNYSPQTIFKVDPTTKTLSPFGSGEAYTEAGFQFGQERLVNDPNEFSGYNVGPIINARAAALGGVTDQLNQFQNEMFGEQTAPKRASSSLADQISAQDQNLAKAMEEFNALRTRLTELQAPNYQQAYSELRNQQGIPQLEQDYLGVRQDRRELPYVQRANTGNAGVATESQLAGITQQADIPLEMREANLIDRLKLAADFVNTSLSLKEMDANTARQALGDAINLVGETINMSRTQLSDLFARQGVERQINEAARDFAVDNRITAPFYNVGDTIYRTSDGKAYSTPEQFFADAGVRSFEEAAQRGLVQNSFITPQERQLQIAEGQYALDVITAQAEAALAANPGLNFDDSMNVLERYLAQSKPFLDVQASYNRILSTDDTAAGDLALIFNYMKMLDPGSVVREGEFATAQNAAGIPDQIRNWYNRIRNGERLNPNQRADFRKQAENLYNAQASQQQTLQNTFLSFASNFQGVDPSISVPDLTSLPGQNTDTPAPPLNQLLSNPNVRQRAEQMQKEGIPYDIIEQVIQEELGYKKKIASTSYLKTLGKVTAFGSPYWEHGLDIDLVKGQPVKSPVAGKVIAAKDNGGFGLQVKIRTADGKEVWLSHLDRFLVTPGMDVRPGQVIGLGGNTGKVIAQGGGDGSHLDVTIKQGDRLWTAKEVHNFLTKTFV